MEAEISNSETKIHHWNLGNIIGGYLPGQLQNAITATIQAVFKNACL